MNNNFFEELEKNDNNCVAKETYNNSLNGTEKNINYFLVLAKVIRIISFIFSAITLLIGLFTLHDFPEIFVICLLASIGGVIVAILSTPFLEWKAYTLKNIYEINKSMNKKK